MNPNAIDAAMICRTIEIIRAMSLTMAAWLLSYKNRSNLIYNFKRRIENNGTREKRRNGVTAQWLNGMNSFQYVSCSLIYVPLFLYAFIPLCRCALMPFLLTLAIRNRFS